MKKPTKEEIIMFIGGVLLLGLGVPLTIKGEALGLAAGVFGLSFVIMSFGWRD